MNRKVPGILVGAACVCLWCAWKLRRKPPRCGKLIVSAPTMEDARYYCDLAILEVPDKSVAVCCVKSSEIHRICFTLEGDFGTIELASILLPDERIYRCLPVVVVRLVYLYCVKFEGDEKKIAHDVHEAAFACVMSAPWKRDTDSTDASIPRNVLSVCDLRVTAECFLFDVCHARHDQLYSHLRVVDTVCSSGLEHHEGDWKSFLHDIKLHFNVDAEGCVDEKALAQVLVSSRNVFSSAMLSASGANKLEMVFGVPATRFMLLTCAEESAVFVAELYRLSVDAFGRWTYENFMAFMHAVFTHDRPEVVRHVPRIFRALNKSRTGEISFDELSSWIARKMSTRSGRHAEQHLLATVMSLRLPYVFFMDKRHLWPKLQCTLRSLSDDDCHT